MQHAKRPVFGNSYSVAKHGQSTTMVESHSLVRGKDGWHFYGFIPPVW